MSSNLNKMREYGALIDKYLRPNTFPLAIRLLEKDEKFPEKCKRPKKDLKIKIFLCQAIKMSRHYGWTIGMNEEDNACLIAAPILNWIKQPFEQSLDFYNNFMVGLYAKNTEVAKKYASNLTVLPMGNNGLVISPLSWTRVEPTIVLIYCNPAQIMRLTQAYLYNDLETGQILSTSTGRIGTCHEGIVKTTITNQPRIIVPGNGDRVWGMAQDYEMLFTIPVDKLEQVVSGLEETHKAGLRYPIPSYMNFQPGFQSDFQQRMIEKIGKTFISED